MTGFTYKIRKVIVVLIATLLLCPYIMPARANQVTLKVGHSDSEGILVDENGVHSGYAVDYLEAISAYTGWEYEYVHDSWENCMDALERGEIDILVLADNTPERQERFLFSELSVAHNYTVIYAPPDSDIYYQDHAAFAGSRIGVAKGSTSEKAVAQYLADIGVPYESVPYTSVDEAREAMLRGEVDMIATSVFSQQADLRPVDYFLPRRTYMAVGKHNPQLMEQLNAAIGQVKIHSPELENTLMKAYYNVDHTVSNLYLTREERLYLDSVGPILIKGSDGRKPLGYAAEDGSYRGILPDYLDYLGKISGLEFIYEPAEDLPLAEHAAAMEAEPYGLFCAKRSLSGLQSDEVSALYRTDELFTTTLAYIRRQGEFVSETGTHTFALNTPLQFLKDLLLADSPSSTVLLFDTSQECMEAVLDGEADMAILDEHVAAYLMQKPIYADRLERVPGRGFYTDGVCLLAPEQHRHLVSILNKTLEHISETEQLYMVSNLSVPYAYEYETEDMLYQYGSLIGIYVGLLLVIVVLGLSLLIRARRLRQQKKEAEALQLKLQRDELTAVYNRRFFFKKARAMIDQGGTDLQIIRLNVSHFKVINELYTSSQGDQLLKAIGRSLHALSEEHGFIAGRFTADHFYLCIEKDVFARIGFAGHADVSWIDHGVNLSYGVYPVDMQSDIPVSAMCDRADMALTAGKDTSPGYIHVYDKTIYQQLLHRQEIESEMDNALAQRQFYINIQPKYDVETERVVGGEALVRWKHPQKGFISPGDFISIFEQNGFIVKLDYFVWEESCRFLAESRTKGLPLLPISINVSRLHFYTAGLQEKLLSLLEQYELTPDCLELEITESFYSREPEMILRQCRALQELGFRIVMDDFGSGYSSLNMLKRMPLDIIKMDLKFLSSSSDTNESARGMDILRTQIQLAHTLNLKVVVEGLETLDQKNFIREIGQCSAQGYFYSRPLDCQSYASKLV